MNFFFELNRVRGADLLKNIINQYVIPVDRRGRATGMNKSLIGIIHMQGRFLRWIDESQS